MTPWCSPSQRLSGLQSWAHLSSSRSLPPSKFRLKILPVKTVKFCEEACTFLAYSADWTMPRSYINSMPELAHPCEGLWVSPSCCALLAWRSSRSQVSWGFQMAAVTSARLESSLPCSRCVHNARMHFLSDVPMEPKLVRANEDMPQGANMRFHRTRLSQHYCILSKRSFPAIYPSNSTLVFLVTAGS